MSAVDRLIGLALVAIGDATAAYEANGNIRAWERAMERAIRTASQAAYITATAERLNIRPDSPLISQARLSRTERQDIQRNINAQSAYLRGFVEAVKAGELSPAQIAARANLYAAGTIRTFYYQMRYGDWEIPDRLLPGQQACMGNCRCTISIRDNGDGTGVLTRTLGGERHCKECPPLAGDHPVKRRGR